jgi:hypothetical protein
MRVGDWQEANVAMTKFFVALHQGRGANDDLLDPPPRQFDFCASPRFAIMRLHCSGQAKMARVVTTAGLMRIFCAAVLFSLGLSHQPVMAVAPLAAYDEAYRLPDGTFSEICSEDSHQKMPAPRPLCEVCLLAASFMPVPPSDDAWLKLEAPSLENRLLQYAVLAGTSSVTQPRSRAPPSSA